MAELEPAAESSDSGHVETVRKYYDADTDRFVRHGQGKTSIHCAVWGPGATTREQAMHWVDEFVVDELGRLPGATSVLDLGCGVGASLLHLATRTSVSGIGVTVSPEQRARASEAFAAAGVAERFRCVEGDFHALDPSIRGVDLAFAIESFVQSANEARFFASAAGELTSRERRLVAEFRAGWRISALHTVSEVRELAERVGLSLVENRDLTPYHELRRPRDIAIAIALRLGRLFRLDSPYLASLRGGDALQLALKSGALAYRVLVFEAHR